MANDSPYFRLRAEAELQRTEAARHPRAAEAHAGLARRYLEAPSRATDVEQVVLGSPSSDHKLHDEWVVRMATAISREHRDFATGYVRARIETADALGHVKSVEAWQSVLERMRSVSLSHED